MDLAVEVALTRNIPNHSDSLAVYVLEACPDSISVRGA